MNNDELLHNKLYEKTKDCGRTQFVKLLMGKEREIERLKSLIKCDYEDSQTIMAELTNENKGLKEQINNLECLVESIKLGVTLNQKQEKLLDKILFRSDK